MPALRGGERVLAEPLEAIGPVGRRARGAAPALRLPAPDERPEPYPVRFSERVLASASAS